MHYWQSNIQVRWRKACCLMVTWFSLLCCAQGFAQELPQDIAEKTMSAHGASIFKVRIVNIKSAETSVYGTGFFIDDGHILATNYHVASLAVLEPENYRAVIDVDGEEHPLRIVAVDVVHDLAILQSEREFPALSLSHRPPSKGVKLYSIGNPHSLGMTVVEGNYNGLVDDRFLDRVHFSGALNSGMSGGPALNARGKVVGVNVATSGNQIGFLVPVQKLETLLDQGKALLLDKDDEGNIAYPSSEQFKAAMGEQIGATTGQMLADILSENWSLEALGDAKVIGKVHQNMECWGNSDDDEKQRYSYVRKGCNNGINIFVNSGLTTGFIEYESWVLDAPTWPSSAFYRRLNRMFDDFRFGNRASKDDVENNQCISDIVARDGELFKRNLVFCLRPYKEFSGLYDVFFVSMSLDKTHQALFEHFTLSGVVKDDAQAFLARFIQQAGWQ